jgi:hypothetical protein
MNHSIARIMAVFPEPQGPIHGAEWIRKVGKCGAQALAAAMIGLDRTVAVGVQTRIEFSLIP